MDSPERGVEEGDVGDENVAGVHKLEEMASCVN